MYNYVFYFFYSFYKRKKENGTRVSASIFTWGAQFIHLVFIYGIVKYVYYFKTGDLLQPANFMKFLFLDRFYAQFYIALPWIIILYQFYNQKRIDRLEQKYSGVKILSLKNSLIIILILIVPLIFAIRIAIITTK